jgi:Protein of unknown function (DUF1302)
MKRAASMHVHTRILSSFLVLAAVLLDAGISAALLRDMKEGKWSLLGKFKTEATFRTVDTPDNNPIPIEAGDLVTQRNLLFLEFQHNVGYVFPWLQIGYFLQGRFFYDSAWDVGPDVLKDDETRRFYLFDNRDQINDLKWDADLFSGYLDMTGGPVFLRVGRQILVWGEMSTFRILDGINPLDTTSLAVDLLERRIPLFMVRTSLTFENVGPFSEASLEGYYIPGCIENRNGEEIIDGSPIIPPIGRSTVENLEDPFSLASLQQIVEQVEDDFDADRYGARLGFLLSGLELNLAYYRAYSDVPVPLIDSASFQPIYLTWRDLLSIDPKDPLGSILGDQKLRVLLKIDKVDVYGGSFNYHWDWIDTVIRGEAALFKNVPKMTAGNVRDLIEGVGGKVYLPPPFSSITLGDLVPLFPLGDLENEVLPFSSGDIRRFDVWKYGIGLDKFTHLPLLSRDEFVLILEYVGSKIMDYEEKTILQPWQGPNGETIYEPEWSNTFVFIATTNYFSGNLSPQLVTMFELEPKALSLIPSIYYEWRFLEFEVAYFYTISDTYEGTLGMLESRNELSLRLTVNF